MAPTDPFYGRPIGVLSHDPNPFWGLPTSTVDWCESNYVHTRYVAEIFNTLSSLPMLLVGLRGLWLSYHYGFEPRVYLCWAGIGCVGIGSMLFHGTLQFYGQAMDELPMIYASLAFTYAAVEASNVAPRRPWLPYLEAVYALGFTVAYFMSPFFFPVFVVAYGFAVLLVIYQSYRVYVLYREERSDAARWQRVLFWVAATFYPGGFLLLWVPENLLCPIYPSLVGPLNLHAIFHIVTTVSPYCYIVFMTYHRCTVLRRPAEHRLGGGLPYVHAAKHKS